MTFLNSVNAFPSWVLMVPSNLIPLRSQRCSGTSASSAFVATANRLASGTTSLLAGEPGRPRLVTPGTLVFVNGLGLGYSDGILDIRLEVDCDSNFSGAGYDGEPDSNVADMTIRLEVDSDSTDSDGGHDGEPDSDVAETTIPSEGEYAGKTDGYDGDPNSDVAETSIPSDGYDSEPDIDVADMTIRLKVDSNSTDSDGGHDGEPDSDVAEMIIPSGGGYTGKSDGEPDSDVAEMSPPQTESTQVRPTAMELK
jgi:hypothetical protein